MNDSARSMSISSADKITLVIPSVSELFCMSIRYLVQDIRDIQVIIVETDCRKFSKLYNGEGNCIVVATYGWLGKSGGPVVKQIMDTCPGLKILMYLKQEEHSLASSLFQSGVVGFFSDSITREEFYVCLRDITAGKTYFSQDIIPAMISRESAKNPGYSSGTDLTSRENEILALIQQGFTNKEIAFKLCLSPRTVEGHRSNLLLKFGVRNTAELVSEVMSHAELIS